MKDRSNFINAMKIAENETSFKLDEDEQKRFNEFLIEHNKVCKYFDDGSKEISPSGAIGGRLTFCFTPTTLGDVVKVKCSCGASIDLTDYEIW